MISFNWPIYVQLLGDNNTQYHLYTIDCNAYSVCEVPTGENANCKNRSGKNSTMDFRITYNSHDIIKYNSKFTALPSNWYEIVSQGAMRIALNDFVIVVEISKMQKQQIAIDVLDNAAKLSPANLNKPLLAKQISSILPGKVEFNYDAVLAKILSE